MNHGVAEFAHRAPANANLDLQFKELMQSLCKDVHSKEEGEALQYVLPLVTCVYGSPSHQSRRYVMTEQLGSEEGKPTFVMIETYKDKGAADAHTQTDHFKAAFAKMEKEELLSLIHI